MALTTVTAASISVTFQEGNTKVAATTTGIRDEFHLNLTLSDGRKLVNVPHAGLGRYVGWYVTNPAETRIHVDALTYRVSS